MAKLKTSGSKEEFTTGAHRDSSSGRGRYDLLPVRAILRLAQRLEAGAAHYGDRNWEKGIPAGRCVESALRHLFQYLGGDRSEDHLGAALFNISVVVDHEERIAEGDLPADLWTLPGPLPFQEEPVKEEGE